MHEQSALSRLSTLAAFAALSFCGATLAQAQTQAPAPAAAPMSMPMAAPAASAAQALQPQVIDLRKMKDKQIGPLVPNVGTLRSKTLVKLPEGTVSIQSGDVPKHMHQNSVEIQYVIAGHGKFWLGDKQVDIHPGDLIIIPKNTAHSGTHANNPRFKVLSIKLPPQMQGDTHMLQ